MKAKDAREISKRARLYVRSTQLKDITQLISDCAKLGHEYVYTDEYVLDEVRASLIKLGYEVGESTVYGKEFRTLISW